MVIGCILVHDWEHEGDYSRAKAALQRHGITDYVCTPPDWEYICDGGSGTASIDFRFPYDANKIAALKADEEIRYDLRFLSKL